MSKKYKKRVILDMALGSSHVHKGRTKGSNLSCSHNELGSLLGWSKPQIKQRFESAIVASLSQRDNRTYAQVLSTKVDNAHTRVVNTVRGNYNSPVSALSAPKQLVANTDSNTSKVKGSSVHRHKKILSQQMDCDIQKVNLSVLGKPQSDPRHTRAHPSNTQVSKSYFYQETTGFRY